MTFCVISLNHIQYGQYWKNGYWRKAARSAHKSSKDEIWIRNWKQTKRSLLRWHGCTLGRLEDLPRHVTIPSFLICSFMQLEWWYLIHDFNAFTSHKWFSDGGRQFIPCWIASSPRFNSSYVISSLVLWKVHQNSAVKRKAEYQGAAMLRDIAIIWATFTHWEPTGDILKMTVHKQWTSLCFLESVR